jgi:hypothetical protein
MEKQRTTPPYERNFKEEKKNTIPRRASRADSRG